MFADSEIYLTIANICIMLFDKGKYSGDAVVQWPKQLGRGGLDLYHIPPHMPA